MLHEAAQCQEDEVREEKTTNSLEKLQVHNEEEIEQEFDSIFCKNMVPIYEEKIDVCENIYNNSKYESELNAVLLCDRWSPVGADYDASDVICSEDNAQFTGSQETLLSKFETETEDGIRYKNMEEEQEVLTTSLLALTSHFAHVQLRVRQIVEAPAEERDQLLKDLEEFAFRGVPEMGVNTNGQISPSSVKNSCENAQDTQHNHKFQLIQHLKSQLTELENLAYESGGIKQPPQHMLLAKQKVIIDELKCKLNLRVEEHELPQLTSEELKLQVDNALGELMRDEAKMRDQLVAQLKTQITDLERFIAYLQCDTDAKINMDKFSNAYNSYAAKSKSKVESNATSNCTTIMPNTSSTSSSTDINLMDNLNSKAHCLLNKASVLMQIFASTHLTNANQFQKNTLKKTHKGNHWG